MKIVLWWSICKRADTARYIWYWIDTGNTIYLFNCCIVFGNKRINPKKFFHFYYQTYPLVVTKEYTKKNWEDTSLGGELERGKFECYLFDIIEKMNPELVSTRNFEAKIISTYPIK